MKRGHSLLHKGSALEPLVRLVKDDTKDILVKKGQSMACLNQ